MKLIKFLLIIVIFSIPSFGQSGGSAASVSEFDVNGLKVIFKRRTSSPTVSVGLFVRGGVQNQTPADAGIENLALSAAVESSKRFPRDVLRKELSRTGSVIGAGSTYDFSVLSLTSTAENFARSWGVFTDVVKDPSFAAADVDRIRSGILAGLRNESASPDSSLDAFEQSVVYAGHPYANRPIGTIENVSRFTPEELRTYYRGLLQTSKMLLVVVGDVDLAEMRKLVTTSFADLPKGNYKSVPLPQLAFTKPTLDITPRALSTNYVKGVFAAPSIGDPDYFAMRVAVALLQSRVYQEVRVKRNLSYAPNAEMGNLGANTGEIYVTAVDANQSISVMLAEIERMRNETVTEDDVTGVPGYFLTTYYVDQETNASQAAELARYELIGGGWRNSLKFLDGIRGVKGEQIKAVANKYMKNLRFVVIGDPKAIDRRIFLGS